MTCVFCEIVAGRLPASFVWQSEEVLAFRHGITLYGQTTASVLPPVPGKDYAQAIIGDYSEVRDTYVKKPVYFILNACRVYAYLAKGRILSKDEGGVYGLETLPVQFHALISQALETYRGERQVMSFNKEMLAQFAAYMDQYISWRNNECF